MKVKKVSKARRKKNLSSLRLKPDIEPE